MKAAAITLRNNATNETELSLATHVKVAVGTAAAVVTFSVDFASRARFIVGML